MPVASFNFNFVSHPNSSAYWGAITYLLSQYPHLVQSGVNGYVFSASAVSGFFPNASAVSGYTGIFFSPTRNSTEVTKLLTPILEYINSTWPGLDFLGVSAKQHPDFNSFLPDISAAQGIGENVIIGNRLLDATALSLPLAELEQAVRDASSPEGILNLNIIGGPGVWNAKPRGGSDSVSPAWRKAYVEFGNTVLKRFSPVGSK